MTNKIDGVQSKIGNLEKMMQDILTAVITGKSDTLNSALVPENAGLSSEVSSEQLLVLKQGLFSWVH